MDKSKGLGTGFEPGLDKIEEYFAKALERLRFVRETQGASIDKAAQAVAKSIQAGGLWYIFGTGHSHMMAEEAFYRAGGLLSVAPILEGSLMLHESAMQSSELERIPGLAERIVENRALDERDVLVVASNSGRNSVPVEMATVARRRGVYTIAITSMEHTERVTSRDPSGKRLFEVVDLVIDNGAPYGDALVEVAEGFPAMGPVSTITGAAIINAMAIQAATALIGAGQPAYVWTSANVDTTDGGAANYTDAVRAVRSRVRHL